MLYFGLLPVLVIILLVVLPSISRPLSNKSAYWQRKKYPDGHLLFMRRFISRSLTPLLYSLSLPPMSTIVILRLAIWYAPRLLFGNLSITVLVYLFQVPHRAIVSSFSKSGVIRFKASAISITPNAMSCLIFNSKMKITLQACYNVTTYKSPPAVIMTAEGLEPSRQLTASSCQDYCGCQLHHAVRSESGEGDLAKDCPSPKLPQLERYHTLCSLTMHKTIIDTRNTIIGGNYDMP